MVVAERCRGLVRTALALSAMLVGATACTVEPEPSGVVYPMPDDTPVPVEFPITGEPAGTVTILKGEQLSSEPGQGVGLFVAYVGDGVWRMEATCDTAVSSQSCPFAYTLRGVGGALAEPVADAKDGSVQVVRYAEGYDVGHVTSTGVDGLTVRVDPPGASLEIAAWLDGYPDARLFYWVSPRGIEQGSSTNPTIFTPATALP